MGGVGVDRCLGLVVQEFSDERLTLGGNLGKILGEFLRRLKRFLIAFQWFLVWHLDESSVTCIGHNRLAELWLGNFAPSSSSLQKTLRNYPPYVL